MADYDDAISAPLLNGYGWGGWFGSNPYTANLPDPATMLGVSPTASAGALYPNILRPDYALPGGRPSLPPGSYKVNSRGEPYSPDIAAVDPEVIKGFAAANAGKPALSATPGAPQPALSALPPAREVGPPPGSGRLSLPQLVQLAQKAGFSPEKAPIAAAIMMGESSGNPFAANEKGEHSYGLSQINADAHGPIAKTALGNPEQAASLMFKISKGGEDFSPWSVFKNGSYKKFLPGLGTARNEVALAAQTSSPAAPPAVIPAGISGGGSPASASLASLGAGGGGGSNNELTQQLLTKLLAPNPSAMLARMAAGFLGGKGPAASLAGGFGAMAEAQKTRDPLDALKTIMALQNMGTKATSEAQERARKNFTAMVNAGVPTAQAAIASGFNLPDAGNSSTAASDVHGADFLKTLDQTTASQVKALAEGRMPFPSGFALKTPYWQNMLQRVTQYDPEFDAVNYKSRESARKDFTSGKSAQAVTSFNTAIGHLGTLAKAAEELQNGSYPAFNTALNFYRENTGDPRVKSFDTARQAVADELTRAFRLSGGNVHDIVGWEKNINAASSPEQLKATIRQAVNLLASRIGAIGEQYKRGMGTTASPLELLSSHARETLASIPGGTDLIQELGGEVPTASVAAPATKLPTSGVTSGGVKWRRLD